MGVLWKHAVDMLTYGVFRLCSGHLSRNVIEKQEEENEKAWEKRGEKGFFETQYNLTDLKYGTAGKLARKLFFNGREMTAAENACEVIAAYNVLLALGEKTGLPKLLAVFSGRGICLNGCFGTSPKALERFFVRKGYEVECLKGRQVMKERLRKLEEDHEAWILTAFNHHQDPFHMVHTMGITNGPEGEKLVHNDNGRCRKAKDLAEAVLDYQKGEGHAICVLGIRRGQMKEM
ncbi:MAG: hypothetical protein K6E50_01760 [Lachnospiraceae bacterium]|nr:hypothetical protein [Lachnospiraceae bacterium]